MIAGSILFLICTLLVPIDSVCDTLLFVFRYGLRGKLDNKDKQ